MGKILRIFPRKTNATPEDENVRINTFPTLFDQADEVKISVAFTWDIPQAEKLYNEWKHVAKTEIGGVALGSIGGEFETGMYLKNGFTITSRGCTNKCWFCSVWKREPQVRELQIKDGHIIQDDNLLACSDQHIKSVFEMLKRQKERIKFSGGIEAKLIKDWHVDLFTSIKLDSLFCAYDTPDDLEPLIEAGKKLTDANITLQNRKACAYVLIGYPKDTIEEAQKRIYQTIDAGFFPFSMLWKNEKGEVNKEWGKFHRVWSSRVITGSEVKKYLEHRRKK